MISSPPLPTGRQAVPTEDGAGRLTLSLEGEKWARETGAPLAIISIIRHFISRGEMIKWLEG
jgi:hypothetical protein